MSKPALTLWILGALAAGCTPQVVDGGATGAPGEVVSSTDESLTGCRNDASTSIPNDGIYVLTTFGGPGDPSDSGRMSCGESTRNCSWYYAASRQRYGCGTRIRIMTATKCVVAETDDYGPAGCVERAANAPVLDASPLVARALFGVSSAGWREHRTVVVEPTDDDTPLGPCDVTTPMLPMTPNPPPNQPAPLTQCDSATLGCNIALTECVQSASDGRWYQCTSLGWVKTYSDGTGLLCECTASYSLGSSCPNE